MPSTLKTTGVSANLLIISKPKFHLPVSADRRVKQRDDYRVAWVTLLPTCPQLGREHPHQLSYTARLRILASLPLRIKTGDYPLAESKGNVGYKSKQKGNRPINKIHANRKVARVACSLRIGGGDVLNWKHLGLFLHVPFSFLRFLCLSVRITVVSFVAELTQEIKYSLFL